MKRFRASLLIFVILFLFVGKVSAFPLMIINLANLNWLYGNMGKSLDLYSKAISSSSITLGFHTMQQYAHLLIQQGKWVEAFSWTHDLYMMDSQNALIRRDFFVAALQSNNLSIAREEYLKTIVRTTLPVNLGLAVSSMDIEQNRKNSIYEVETKLKSKTHDASDVLIERIDWLTQPICHKDDRDFASDIQRIIRQQYPQLPAFASEDLSVNGGFEDVNIYDRLPNDWMTQQWVNGQYYGKAFFVTGIDCPIRLGHKQRSIRIQGLYHESNGDKENARAGFWHPKVKVDPNSSYLVTFLYRSSANVKLDALKVYFANNPENFVTEVVLPPSNGTWVRAVIVSTNHSVQESTIAPLFRLWDVGNVWFDDLAIFRLASSPKAGDSIYFEAIR